MIGETMGTLSKIAVGSAATLLMKFTYDYLTAGKQYVTHAMCKKSQDSCSYIAGLTQDVEVHKAQDVEKMNQVKKEISDVHASVKSSAQDIAQIKKSTTIIMTYMKVQGIIPNDLETP